MQNHPERNMRFNIDRGLALEKRRFFCEEQRPKNSAASLYVMYNNLKPHNLNPLLKFSREVTKSLPIPKFEADCDFTNLK